MTMEDLQPEEFAQAADAAITDALNHQDPRKTAEILAQAGLCGVMAAEADGGLGLDISFALPIVHAAGRLRLPFPLPEQILLGHTLANSTEGQALAAGERIGTIAWQGNMNDAWIRIDHGNADWALVADDNGAVLIDIEGLLREEQATLDPDHPQTWIATQDARVLTRLDSESWSVLQRQAHILLAEFANGAAEGALQETANYMATRVQFGRPLSAKQAVRHLLARMRLLQEVSSAAVRRTIHSDEFGQARDTRPALAGAIANAAFVIEKAIHLHGGMGFTWELPLHRALRAVRKLSAAFDSLAQENGRAYMQSV